MGQLIANIIFSASFIFLAGISFSLIYSTARFFHFAHAAIITFGAYSCFAFSLSMALPRSISIILALATCTGIGWFLDFAIYRQLRLRNASPLILLIASLGLYIVLQNGISMGFGDDTKMIGKVLVSSPFNVLDAKITSIQMVVITSAIIVFFAKMLLLDRSSIGLTLRAVANSSELAIISGIDFNKTMGIAFCLGSFLAGATGLFRAYDVGMTPTMGLPMLLLGVVAVILGGSDKTMGTAVASIFLASFQQITGWQLGTHWQETVVFILLLSFLSFRPQGLFGRASKTTSM